MSSSVPCCAILIRSYALSSNKYLPRTDKLQIYWTLAAWGGGGPKRPAADLGASSEASPNRRRPALRSTPSIARTKPPLDLLDAALPNREAFPFCRVGTRPGFLRRTSPHDQGDRMLSGEPGSVLADRAWPVVHASSPDRDTSAFRCEGAHSPSPPRSTQYARPASAHRSQAAEPEK